MHLSQIQREHQEQQRGFSLIEFVAVLAVIAIFAAIITPSFVRRMDRAFGDQESLALKTFGRALETSAMRNRYIPGYTDWASVIAAEAGVNTPQVLTSPRNLPRYLLIDPSLSINGSSLPYAQPNSGCSTFPSSPRLIILSSVGQPLSNMSTNPSAADFNAIWNWTDSSGTPPSATVLNGLTRGDDLKVQRINLAPYFVNLVLSSYDSVTNGFYSIDWSSSNAVTNSAPFGNGFAGYFIKGTRLRLYANSSAVDSEQILIRDNSFVFYEGVWRDSIFGAPVSAAGLADLSAVVVSFLNTPPNQNPSSTTSTTAQVVQAMISYMQAYDIWAGDGSNWAHNNNWNAAVAAQGTMMSYMYNLYFNNIPPQVACP